MRQRLWIGVALGFLAQTQTPFKEGQQRLPTPEPARSTVKRRAETDTVIGLALAFSAQQPRQIPLS
jgi:hypothetical protein